MLPLVVHVMDQPELAPGEGPIAAIVAPTRELAEQIHRETRRFSKPYGIRSCAAFGGLNKYDQCKDLKAGAEVRRPRTGNARAFACHLTVKHARDVESGACIWLRRLQSARRAA